MKLTREAAELYIPDGAPLPEALTRTTHMGIGAHQDDLEMNMHQGILACFGRTDAWFAGVTVTDGAGSPRAGLYADYTDEQMRRVRRVEQKKAACVGEYGAQFLLDHTSAQVKGGDAEVVEELYRILDATRPETVFTHALTDKHDTHASVALRALDALRRLPADARPKAVYGCEGWRSLDWLVSEDVVLFDVSPHENLAAALMGVFDSQIAGGKRYDLALAGRRRGNATLLESHATDLSTAAMLAMDLTPLVTDPSLDIIDYAAAYAERLVRDVRERLTKLKR